MLKKILSDIDLNSGNIDNVDLIKSTVDKVSKSITFPTGQFDGSSELTVDTTGLGQINDINAPGYSINITNHVAVLNRGPQGYTGPKGTDSVIAGAQGIKGDSGEKGPQGYTGAQGPRGLNYVGDRGVQGYTGPAGIDAPSGIEGMGQGGLWGIQGYTGRQGLIGSAGNQGEDGNRGAQGYTGSKGDSFFGDFGSQGTRGARFQGTQGITGAPNPVGRVGNRGIKGITGAQGIQGLRGHEGYNYYGGPSGDRGPQGYTGAKGDNVVLNMGPYSSDATAGAMISRDSNGASHAVRFNASEGFFHSSDIRKKNVIKYFHDDSILDKLHSLRKILYKYKSSTEVQIGLIAQDIEKLYPELVSKDSLGFLSLDYGKVNILAMEALMYIAEKKQLV